MQSPDAEAQSGAWHPFFVLIAFTRATPVPLTYEQQIQEAVAIFEGHFEDVSEGRVVDYDEGAANPLRTAVFKIRVDEVFKGELGEHAYVEFVRDDIPIDRMKPLLPTEIPMIFVLRDANESWPDSTYRFENDGAGLPEGGHLYSFLYPSGVVLEGDDGLDYPLADMPFDDVFPADSLAEMRDLLADIE